jgi:CRISPR-associated protein Csx10
MPYLSYRLRLEQPLLTSTFGSDPNSSSSYDYIPGSTMRGVLADRYQKQATSLGLSTNFEQLFLTQQVRFLHAYPLINGQRSAPTPRSLVQDRTNLSSNTLTYRKPGTRPDPNLRTLSAPFCLIEAGSVQTIKPERDLSVHVQRDAPKGRAWRQEETTHGAVFRYEALAAGQEFGGVIVADDLSLLRHIETLLRAHEQAWIGRSRSAHYGRVQIILAEKAIAEQKWREVSASERPSNVFVLHCMSDLIVRDTHGRVTATANCEALSLALGIQIEDVAADLQSGVVGGFNRTWRAPLPQNPVIQAGSVLLIRSAQPPNQAQVTEWLHAGIGERRNEGFGQIAINWLASEQTDYSLAEKTTPAGIVDTVDPSTLHTAVANHAPSRDLAQRMLKRLVDAEVNRAIVAYIQTHIWDSIASNTSDWKEASNSQLARLRTIIRKHQFDTNCKAILQEYNNFRSTAKKVYERAIVGTQSLDELIRDLLCHPEHIWNYITKPTISLAGQQLNLSSDDNKVYVLRLLVAILEAPAQRRKNPEVT